jgi:hypothetical protein
MRKACIVSALIIAALPGQARAADKVLVDPDSPSGTEYQIPFVGERESGGAKQSRRSEKSDPKPQKTDVQSAPDGEAARSGDRKRKRARDVGRLFGKGIGPNASTDGGLAGSSPDLQPDRGEPAPLWTVVVWIAALLTAVLVIAAGALFLLPEGVRTRVLGRFGGFGERTLARLRIRRPGA